MKRVHSCRLCCLVLLLVLPLAAFGQQNSPDYTNKSDILNGRRVLLKVDDIVLFGEHQRDTFRDMGFNFYNSTNSAIGAPAGQPTANTAVNPRGGRARVIYGRWWESNVDMPALLLHEAQLPLTLILDRRVDSPHGAVPTDGEADIPCMIAADFTGDGYDDLLLGTYPANGNSSLVLASASDTTKPSAPKFGPPLSVPRCMTMAKADLNGDGQLEVAYASGTAAGGVQITIYTFNRTNLSFTQAGSFTLSTPEGTQDRPITKASITAGNFRGDGTRQLGIAYAPDDTETIVKTIDIDARFQMKEVDRFATGSWPRVDGIIQLRAVQLFTTQPKDYLVFFFAWHGNAGRQGAANKYLKVFGVDPTLKLTANPNYDFSTYDCVYDFAVGNFDYHVQDPTDANKTELSLDKQLALVGGNCDSPTTVDFHILTLSTDLTFKDTTSTVPAPLPAATAMMMIAGDAQGRSMILGQPTKFELSQNIQTSVVVAAPPSHVDYITPVNGNKPVVLNISAMPEGFKTSYSAQTKGQNQTSNTSGTSWGVGSTQSLNQTLSIGDLDAGEGLEEKSAFTAAQNFKGESDKENGSYSGYQFDVSSSSGAGDNFWYSGSRLNVWTYPVLGRTVCPKAAGPNCTAAQKVPLTLIYSAPDQIENGSTTQEVSTWYQPSWEYGNLFSYPVNLAQMQALFPSIDLLTSGQDTISVSGGDVTVNANWTSGQSSGSKSSFTQNYSFDASLSVQGAFGFGGVNIGGGYSFDLSSSFGFSSQTTNQQSLDTTTGISVNKPGGMLAGTVYGYSATPYIYGRKKPANIVDSSKQPDATVKSYGALRSAFSADITSTGAGGFWRQAYSVNPDIGLSHPSRWAHTSEALQSPVPVNCLRSGANNSEMNCFDVNLHTPNNPWISSTLFMQGFFITNSSAGPSDPTQLGSGPNLTYTNAGTKLRLQARVYNFSFAALPSGSSVHVQFYGMPMNTANNMPEGAPFKIGPIQNGTPQDVILQPVPPLSDGATSRNWTYATTDFDTTTHANQDLAFWVVVWAQTSDGKLVQEIQGHGLTAVPAAVVSDMSTIPVEMNASVAGPLVTYSNNIGFYRSILHIAPAPSQLQGASGLGDKKTLRLAPVKLSSRSVNRNQRIEITTAIRPVTAAVPGAVVKFYDGHPDEGGTLIQAEVLSYIRPDARYQLKITFDPRKNGLRRIWAFVNQGTQYESVRASPVLCVGKSCFVKTMQAEAEDDSALDPRERP